MIDVWFEKFKVSTYINNFLIIILIRLVFFFNLMNLLFFKIDV